MNVTKVLITKLTSKYNVFEECFSDTREYMDSDGFAKQDTVLIAEREGVIVGILTSETKALNCEGMILCKAEKKLIQRPASFGNVLDDFINTLNTPKNTYALTIDDYLAKVKKTITGSLVKMIYTKKHRIYVMNKYEVRWDELH